MVHTSLYLFFLLSNCTYNSHIIKNETFLRTLCAFSILVRFTSFKLSTLGVRHPTRIPSDRLLFDETFAQPCMFVVVNCADVALSAFYSRYNALPDNFAVMNCSCLRIPLIIYVHYIDTLQPTTKSKERACRIICTRTPENGASPPLSFQKVGNGGGGAFSS